MSKQLWISKQIRTCRKWSLSRKLRRWTSNCGKLWANTWLWEMSSISLSGVCIILIVAILLLYDQRPVPEFTYGITLNAVLSTLTTFSKSFLLVAISGAISQLKWRWFQSTEGRGINDIQLFDDASRGPWGSLVFLAMPSKWSLTSMGALLSIIALALEPFTQHLTTYPARDVVVSTPGVRPPTLYRAKSYLVGKEAIYEIGDVINRLTAPIWDTSDEAERFAAIQCSTGNCTWEDFESLAFCTSCQNRTNALEQSDTTLSWDGSTFQQVQDAIDERFYYDLSLHLPADLPCPDSHHPNITVTADFSKSQRGDYIYASCIKYERHLFGACSDGYTDFLPLRHLINEGGFHSNSSDFLKWQSRKIPLMSIYHVELKTEGHKGSGRILERQATSYDFIPCVKKYSFSISNGVPTVNTVGERYGSWYFHTTDLNENLRVWEVKPQWVDVEGRNGIILKENSTDPCTNLSSRDFSFDLSQDNAYCADDERNRISKNRGIQFSGKSLITYGQTYGDQQTVLLAQIVKNGGLTWAAPRMAAAASKYLRDKGAIPVEGHAYRSIIIVEIRWPWLALPVTTWLCGVMFLGLTILPLIYHGFKDQDVATFKTSSSLEGVSEMEKYSENLYTRIRRDSNDRQLRLMRTPPATQP
ncbi:hypothetical protein GGR55DRAFT_701954 [Xylaria sp. FL0064]|nr:hypothetical protein GGR55DRAFT_701954 [Xylaria sp. FL0064]